MTTTTKSSSALRILLIGSVAWLCVGISNIAIAADNRPHQHGEGELNIVIDDHDLVLELRLPAADVVGFEKSPKDAEQKKKVEQALASFKAATAWFEPAKQAQCALESAQASLVGMSTKPDKHKAESSHDHDHSHSDKHNDKHTDASHSEDVHSDFEGTMQFHCEAPDKLDALTVLLFKSFPGVSELRVQMITSTSQMSQRLTPEAAVLVINP